MEHLPQTKGKGLLMFAKRRQRMDELSAEQEEMRQKGIPVDAFVESEVEMEKPAPQGESKQYQEQPYQQQVLPQAANGLNDLEPYQSLVVSRSLVSNRTAKPFSGGHNQGQEQFSHVRGISSPTSKKPEIFKVRVPVNTIPKVWSPTTDIIASRDERIAIPAIKTGILPETKRRGASNSKDMPQSQKKGDQRSLIESGPEEDFLSLGAEACNFMQTPTIKQKNPPPVLPKPVINPAHPPWSTEGSHSPLPASNLGTGVGTQVQKAPQPNPSQPIGKAWTSLPSQPILQQAWTPTQTPASFQSARTPPVSLHAGPSQSKMSWIKSQNDRNSVSSCPPQPRNTYYNAPNAPSASPKAYSPDPGPSEGMNLKGKGAELFARRQSRMEKFVVDDETVQANKARSSSPTLSMPSTWKYSSNIRAPPPVSYNPILSPFYPLAAAKQPPPALSPKTKPKANKEKAKPPAKHLNALDVMKHQPYQLDSSLFMYNLPLEAASFGEFKQDPAIFKSHSPTFEPSAMHSPFPNSLIKGSQPVKQNPSKASGQGFNRTRSLSLPQKQFSVSSSSSLMSTPGVHPTRELLTRQYSWVEQPKRQLSAREEVAQSPFCLDKAKSSSSHRKSLPETSAEWKKRTCCESFADPQEMVRTKAVKSTTCTFSSVPKKPILYGPPFRPAQPLCGPNTRYSRGNSLPRNFTLQTNYTQSQRVSWKL